MIQYQLLNVDVFSQAPPVIGCFAPLCLVQPRGGGADCDGQSLPRIQWLPIWFAASLPEPTGCSFSCLAKGMDCSLPDSSFGAQRSKHLPHRL
ncbi:hypothetical protein DPMN_183809 [Dreissena polymorpha]|uniref:Uncharacterized protein n=1 Tax=Dreissena polymorpha TaxID=45954 RepID=A0A9D4DI22_DREPO|nr:hypothetical protein DPMN_183809 [Dreissena polymorpha]